MEKYEFISDIGEGVCGRVGKYTHRTSRQTVAIKSLKEGHMSKDSMHVALRGIRLMNFLKSSGHPNIVQLQETITSKSGRLHIVMEHVNGNLSDLIHSNPNGCPEVRTKLLVWQLLQATAYLHCNKIMHRDLKPANILMSRDGTLKLCDFGLARETSSTSVPYTSYVVTRWYRAPEVLVGSTYGMAVDIWSIGCILCELATGEPLFPGDNSLDQLWMTIQTLGSLPKKLMQALRDDLGMASFSFPTPSDMTTLDERFPQFCPQLMEVIKACLCLDPEKRLTAMEVLALPYFDDTHKLLVGTELQQLYDECYTAAVHSGAATSSCLWLSSSACTQYRAIGMPPVGATLAFEEEDQEQGPCCKDYLTKECTPDAARCVDNRSGSRGVVLEGCKVSGARVKNVTEFSSKVRMRASEGQLGLPLKATLARSSSSSIPGPAKAAATGLGHQASVPGQREASAATRRTCTLDVAASRASAAAAAEAPKVAAAWQLQAQEKSLRHRCLGLTRAISARPSLLKHSISSILRQQTGDHGADSLQSDLTPGSTKCCRDMDAVNGKAGICLAAPSSGSSPAAAASPLAACASEVVLSISRVQSENLDSSSSWPSPFSTNQGELLGSPSFASVPQVQVQPGPPLSQQRPDSRSLEHSLSAPHLRPRPPALPKRQEAAATGMTRNRHLTHRGSSRPQLTTTTSAAQLQVSAQHVASPAAAGDSGRCTEVHPKAPRVQCVGSKTVSFSKLGASELKQAWSEGSALASPDNPWDDTYRAVRTLNISDDEGCTTYASPSMMQPALAVLGTRIGVACQDGRSVRIASTAEQGPASRAAQKPDVQSSGTDCASSAPTSCAPQSRSAAVMQQYRAMLAASSCRLGGAKKDARVLGISMSRTNAFSSP